MGTNSHTWDANKEYAKKSMKELMALRVKFEEAATEYPNIKRFNEHLEFIKMKIAERIGK